MKKNNMTQEWHDYFSKMRVPSTSAEWDWVSKLTGVSAVDCYRYFQPYAERCREDYWSDNLITIRVAIQAKRKEMHEAGFMIHPPPDPWMLSTPVHVRREDSIALARAAEGPLDEEALAERREKKAGAVLERLRGMRANLCEACGGVGGTLDGAGDVTEPCTKCEGKGIQI
jgi:hypothetical protein